MDAYRNIPDENWAAITESKLEQLCDHFRYYRKHNFPDGSGYETLKGELFAVQKIPSKDCYGHKEALAQLSLQTSEGSSSSSP